MSAKDEEPISLISFMMFIIFVERLSIVITGSIEDIDSSTFFKVWYFLYRTLFLNILIYAVVKKSTPLIKQQSEQLFSVRGFMSSYIKGLLSMVTIRP